MFTNYNEVFVLSRRFHGNGMTERRRQRFCEGNGPKTLGLIDAPSPRSSYRKSGGGACGAGGEKAARRANPALRNG